MINHGFNEGKACDAVLRSIETRERSLRSALRLPERERHAAPIELACRIGDRLYAFEHTGIEPFSGHVQMEAEAERRFRPIEDLVAGKLPPAEDFQLAIPVNAMRDLRGAALSTVQRDLARWIVDTAPILPTARLGRFITPIQKLRPRGVPFEVSLHRSQTLYEAGRFQMTHVAKDVEQSRLERIGKACASKFPKLAAWKEAQARTVLVLEENDIQLTNFHTVLETLQEVERDRADRPNEIWLVSTTGRQWYVYPLRVDGRSLYDMDRGKVVSKVDPIDLRDLTAKIPA